jgi:hypothetical protein
VFLRAFRDEVLSQSRVGRSVIWIYYNVGPFAAKLVQSAPFLKLVCRRVLDRVIIMIEKRTSLKREAL